MVAKLKDLTKASTSTIWRRANPEKYQRHLKIAALKRNGVVIPKAVKTALTKCYHSAKTSAAVDNRDFTITKEDVFRLWELQSGKCKMSGLNMQLESGTQKERNNMRVSIDRINNRRGYTKNNIHLVVWQFNNAKGAGSIQETIDFCKAVASNN